MKLQILIPQYKETDEVIKPMLDSIAIQQSIDFNDIGVIIVNDGSDVFLSDELLSSYPYTIEYYKEEHRGVSGTRNSAFEHSTADYVMFCDADDMFFNACGLWMILREISIGVFDSLVSAFVEESRHPITKEVVYINHDMDSTFVHGKVHRRGYLLEKNIRWNQNLTIHEDSFFNILCQNLSTNVKYCQTPFYLWKWRDESVCRHDPQYILKTYNNMIDSNDALIKEFSKRNRPDKAGFYVAFMVFDAYYTMNKPQWTDQENVEYRTAVEKRFRDYFAKHRELWEGMPTQTRMILSNNIRTRQVKEGMLMETKTISQWLEEIAQEGQSNGREMS